jgi:lipopolysaccharide transport system permease protein
MAKLVLWPSRQILTLHSIVILTAQVITNNEFVRMNPHTAPPVSVASLAESFWTNRNLIAHMTKRDVVGRYRGSVVGVMWSFLNPMFLLAVYTIVFSQVFKASWGGAQYRGTLDYALPLFVGMIVHTFFAETLIRAPGTIVNNVNYVKKIVFPVEILPVVASGTAFFHTLVSLLVLLGGCLLLNGYIYWTAIFLPFVLLPLMALTIGLAWILASLGVFLRDIAHPIGLAMTVLQFASPVFYPLEILPPSLRSWLMFNPLTLPIEQSRAVLIFGEIPDFSALTVYALISLITAWIGYAWFQETRRGFANVL